MKKKILGLALLVGTVMLTSCTDPSDNSNSSDSVVINANFGDQNYPVGTFTSSALPGMKLEISATKAILTCPAGYVSGPATGSLELSPFTEATATRTNTLLSVEVSKIECFAGGPSCSSLVEPVAAGTSDDTILFNDGDLNFNCYPNIDSQGNLQNWSVTPAS